MARDSTVIPFRQPDAIDDPLTEIAREGARLELTMIHFFEGLGRLDGNFLGQNSCGAAYAQPGDHRTRGDQNAVRPHARLRKVFDIEGINLDDLISTAFDDPQAIAHENFLFRGINFRDFQAAYRQFCSDKEIVLQAFDLGDVIDFYNKAAAELPDHSKLKGLKLSGTSVLLDGAGRPFADLFEENKRRAWVLSPTSRRMCSWLSLRPRTSAFISTRGSTNAA